MNLVSKHLEIPLLEKYIAHLPEQVEPLWIGYHGYDAYEDSLWDYPGYQDTKPKTPSPAAKEPTPVLKADWREVQKTQLDGYIQFYKEEIPLLEAGKPSRMY